MRLNKYIANAGYCSRRKADELIQQGKVMVNNRPVKEMGVQVDPAVDEVRIKGGPVLRVDQETVVLLFHKPKGIVCTKRDDYGARTVFDLLPKSFQHLNTVGRLDKDSEGLLLLTNDGTLANQLTHPRYGKEKVYRVTVRGKVDEKDLSKIRKGMRLLEYATAPAKAELISYNPKEDRSLVEVILAEGKKRQIRNMFLALKKPVKKLVRLKFGKYRLGKLKVGEWIQAKEK